MPIKVLFICHGNICRSPMAKYVMREMVENAGLSDHFYIDSAATSTEELGNPVYPPAVRKLSEHGIDCRGHAARQITRADYDDYDLLIGMDGENMYYMKRRWPVDPEGKLHLLLDFTDNPRDISDPWYTRDFETTWREINEGCAALLSHLRETGALPRSV